MVVAAVEEGPRVRMVREDVREHALRDILAHQVDDGRVVAVLEDVAGLPCVVLGLEGEDRGVGEGGGVLGEHAVHSAAIQKCQRQSRGRWLPGIGARRDRGEAYQSQSGSSVVGPPV